MIRLLADDMGLGKTRVACHLIPKGWGCIVTAPVNVKYGWQKELNSLFPDLLTTVCKSPKDFRLPIAGEVVIANYEQINDHVVPLVARHCCKLVMIADEMHLLKNNKAKRTIRWRNLAQATRNAGGVTYGLTGTPLLNRTKEVWEHAISLGVVKEVFPKGWTEFTRLAGMGQVQKGPVKVWDQVTKPLPEFKERIARFCLRRTRSETFAQTPPKLKIYHPVPLTGAEGTRLKCQLMDLQKVISGRDPLEAMKDKLILENISRIRALSSLFKVEELMKIIDDHEEEFGKDLSTGLYTDPLVVAGVHREVIDIVGKRKDWGLITGDTRDIDRAETAALFQQGKLAGVALTIQAGGAGINLYREGANRMIFVDRDWTEGWNLQAEDRLRPHLIKQQCVYTILTLDHPIDFVVQAALDRKIELMKESGVL